MTADYLQEVLSEVSTKKKTRKRVTLLANKKGGMRNNLPEVISTATYVKEVKTTCCATRKVSNRCSKRCSKRCYKRCYMRSMASNGPQLTSKRCYERCSKRIYRRCFIATRRDHLLCYCARGRAAAGCVILMLPQETSRKHGRRHVSFVCGVVLFAVTRISSARLLPHFRRFHQAPPRGTGPHPLLHIPPFARFRALGRGFASCGRFFLIID